MTEWMLFKALMWRKIGIAAQAVRLQRVAGRAWARANSALDGAYEALQAEVKQNDTV